MAGRSCSLQAEPGRKGPKGWRGRLRKNQQKAQPAHPPPLSLWSSNSLILNLRLPPPPQPTPPLLIRFSPLKHTHMHSSCSYHWLPSSHPKAMNGQTGTKPNSSPLRKSNHWVWALRGAFCLTLSWFLSLSVCVCVLTINHMSCDCVCVVHLVPHD